jgi:alpha-N-arabinofuranosidase
VKGKTLSVTLTNPSLDSPLAAKIRVRSGSVTDGRGTVLTHSDMTARNTFDNPENVKPKAHPVSIQGNGVQVSIPQHAVVLLELQIT